MNLLLSVLNWLKDWRHTAIVVQGILLLGIAVVLAVPYFPVSLPWGLSQPEGEPVSVIDVGLDREQLRSLQLIFDHPLGEGRIGEVLGEEPAEIEPWIGGVWRWEGANVLRFEASGRFAMATVYQLTIRPDRVLSPDQFLREETFEVVTDQFQVERMNLFQETLATKKQQVIVRGEVRFNYPVNPKELATRFHLVDPLSRTDRKYFTLETTHRSRVIAFRSDPLTKHDEGRRLKIVINSRLSPAEGNVTLASDFVKTITLGSRKYLRVVGTSPVSKEKDSILQIHLSSPVNAELAAKFIEIEPSVEFELTVVNDVINLAGGFRPGENYGLTVKSGMVGVDESVLGSDFEQSVHFPDLPPEVDFLHQGEFLSSRGTQNVAIRTVNVDRIDLAIDRVYTNNLYPLFRFHGYTVQRSTYYRSRIFRGLGDRIAEITIRPSGSRNESVESVLNLAEHVGSHERGLYRVTLMRPGSHRGIQRWLLVTDLGIVAKKSGRDFVVWVSSFSDLRPIANARVELLSDQNQVIARGRTDRSGIWRLRNFERLSKDHRPYLLTIERSDDLSFLLFDRHEIGTTGLDLSGSTMAGSGYHAFLYGERNIYRPGESVKGAAVVRDRDLKIPPTMPALLNHLDPQGQKRGVVKLETNRDGISEFEIELPEYARTGNHKLELVIAEQVIGSYQFQVEEFVPDRIKVEIQTDSERILSDEQIAFEVSADYLFGAPAGGLDVESRVWLQHRVFTASRFTEYSFQDESREFDVREIFSGQGQLDETGKGSFSTELPKQLRVPSALEAVITARVQEQGGRGVTAIKRILVDPYPYYLGLRRLDEGYSAPGSAVRFEYVAVSPQGDLVETRGLRAELYNDRWHTVLRRTSSGSYRYENSRESFLVETRVVPSGETRGDFSFTPPAFGSYRAVVTDAETGVSSQIEFYASGWGDAPWAIKNPVRIELDLDKNEYRVGENAMIQVRAPFKGRLWLTVEQEKLHYSRVYDLSGNTAQIEVPVRPEYRPNVYVTATLIRAADALGPDQSARAFGAVPLFVDRTPNRLSVQMDVPEEIRPFTTATINVESKPGAAITVAAVDEGILQLVAQKTPDPFSFFYQKRVLSMRSFDTFALLMPNIEGESSPGGGRGAAGIAQFVQTGGLRRVKPVAFWSGLLKTDSAGRAQAQFEVPEFQGSLRVMAVAHSGDQFGSSDQFMRVRDPLVLLPTFPRVLSFEEEVDIPVTVRNDTGDAGEFNVALLLEGPANVAGERTKKVELANETEKTIYFRLRTSDQSGLIGMKLRGTGNSAQTNISVEVPVRADLPQVTLESVGQLQGGENSLPAEDTAALRPQTVKRELRVSPLPLIQFTGKLRYLLGYPYGCVEQTTSRAFPLVYFGDLAKELDPELFEESNPEQFVRAAVDRLSTMQLNSGGFAMWPFGRTLHPWGSVYATHFLVEARRGGHFVHSFLYDRALDFLTNEVKGQTDYTHYSLERIVYALYVLARADRADWASMNLIRQRHVPKLRIHSRAMLGAALATAGDARALEELVRGVEDVAQIERQTGQNFGSTVRNRAILLLALIENVPHDPRIPDLVDRLARDSRANRYWNTQETGFAFLALGQFFQQQLEQPDYSGKVLAGNRLLGTFTKETKVFKDLPAEGPLTVELEGQSPSVFYVLFSRGVPTDSAFRPESNGIEVKREFFSRDGSPISLDEIVQGDLITIRTQVRSVAGKMENVVLQNLLASGLEVENPRLKTTETTPFMVGSNPDPAFLDLRDDRILVFLDLPDKSWQVVYTLVRAVTPGKFRLPPVQAEAMYNPSLMARGQRGTVEVRPR